MEINNGNINFLNNEVILIGHDNNEMDEILDNVNIKVNIIVNFDILGKIFLIDKVIDLNGEVDKDCLEIFDIFGI